MTEPREPRVARAILVALLPAEDAERADAGTIVTRLTLLEDVPQQVEVGLHRTLWNWGFPWF